MFAKLIDGCIERLKMPLKTQDRDIFTNDENIILANGYKPVIYSDMPLENAIWHWEETDTQIIQTYQTE